MKGKCMPFDPSNLNPTKTFVWPHSTDEQEEWIELRLVPDDMNRAFFKQIGAQPKSKLVFNPKTHQPSELKDYSLTDRQIEEYSELVWDYSICGWFLITPNGEEIPCTMENKIRFMKESPAFAQWVADCLEEMRESVKQVKEIETKNS